MMLFSILLTLILLAIIIIDLRQQIIPDALNIALALLGVASICFLCVDSWANYALCAITLGGIGALLAGPYSRWRGRDMLGWGDVKFLAAAGLWLPLHDIGYFLFIAGILGTIFSLIYRAKTGRAETPFAPALCIALWVMVIAETHLVPGGWLQFPAVFPAS